MARPRAFDIPQALDQAMRVFWRDGYEGASVSALTAAMGINPPSLYAAFGSKEGLFRAVLDRYGDHREPFVAHVLAAPTAREAAERYLRGSIDMAANADEPPGCLLVQAGTNGAGEARAVPEELASRRREVIQVLADRFARAKAEGDLPASANPVALAAYLATIAHGIGVQAASGVELATLRDVVEVALSGLAVTMPAQVLASRA